MFYQVISAFLSLPPPSPYLLRHHAEANSVNKRPNLILVNQYPSQVTCDLVGRRFKVGFTESAEGLGVLVHVEVGGEE